MLIKKILYTCGRPFSSSPSNTTPVAVSRFPEEDGPLDVTSPAAVLAKLDDGSVRTDVPVTTLSEQVLLWKE